MSEEVSRGALNPVRVEWIAAAFGLLTGITMVYVPYEFGTSIFRLIYPHIRLLGTVFMAGSATMLVALLYPTWPAWVGWIGRTLFLGALAVYWWGVTVLAGGITGALVYPLMVTALIAEALPRWHTRGFFSEFLLTTALAFGGFIVMDPILLGPSFYDVYQPVARLMGVLFLVGGGLLAVGQVRREAKLSRLAVGFLAALFGQMGLVAGWRGSWTGLVLYSVITLGCGFLLFRRQWETSTVGWRLFRGVALASVLPILAVGGLASVVAQRAIERELRDKARQAVAAEVAWLEQTASMARFVLRTQTRDPLLQSVLTRGDKPALRSRLTLLRSQPGPFDAAWVLDDTGQSVLSTEAGGVVGDFSHRDYFQEGRREDQVYLSRPFLNVRKTPMVVFASPVKLEEGRQVLLVAGMSLVRMSREPTLASLNYHVEIFDRRNGELLRETNRGDMLSRAPILSIVDDSILSLAEGFTEAVDPGGGRLLVAHAPVQDTPWTVAVTAPLRQAFAPVTRLSALVVFIALTAGAVALLLSRWVGRDVAQRLTALRDGFAVLGTRTLDRGVPAQGDDELAELAAGFNEMAARIERTQKELREAITSRDQFLSMASHELRTPLTPLKATIELMLRQSQPPQGVSPEKQRSTLERLRRQVDRLTRLIGDMLDVSRMQSGRFSLRRATMDLSALAREVVDRIEHARSERTAPIRLELPEQPLLGQWDDQRLDQLLTNLVENAVRYSPPDKPIHVRLRPEGDGVLMEVEDQGIGVPSENLSNLFEPFFRAQNAAEHHAGGLGLGLAICREIVERHEGTIRAASAGPGQGTRFSVLLPRGEPDAS
ncbi:sensor histidine kinase [Melittangium boletus]|uniref:sensor histidine kinase n=1 Tax=Melittangium boletus TaxID=83453 RepID=UPI001FE783C3|nr:ATP-binding protein [Melittangium boletus]